MTLLDLLATGEANATALVAPGSPPLSYATLRNAVDRLAGQLRNQGIGPGDRVALVLPNGPEMAVAFLAVSSCATAAPLNPKYREDEFRFYLNDLSAKALITRPGDDTPALRAAPRATRRLELSGETGEPTLLREGVVSEAATPQRAAKDDTALVLHTSGTTSRPKIVPLTQSHLAASARNIVSCLALTPGDRCLNAMPLFHIHGLVAGLLAPLAAGGSVACPAGFDAFQFFHWLEELRPTWYTAVPTMHQLILARSRKHADVIARTPLRFARSSSASLPQVVLEGIEKALGVPVIEAYGMTEASHQMASNPLPPAPRKAGSVGRATGIEIAIADDQGRLLPQGERGEVVIRGDTVIRAYENNPDANRSAFFDSWFRTGDQGTLDRHGYLFLTGRLKEIINRGGEKVSPLEVDEVLLRHTVIAQAVTFAVPHEKLGEEVAAAVVLEEGASIDARALRQFAAEHLAPFKVPHTIVVLDEIPKGPTGKVQRIGLAERLGLGPGS